jgi:hypothetical protein
MLTYLFEATYKDGTSYKQNAEDVSLTDPLRSCFYDIKQEEVQTFTLIGNGHCYTVDLSTGAFAVDGVPFFMHDLNDELKDFRLIFYRRHTHSFNPEGGQEMGHDIAYCLGWQTNDKNGENVKRIMQII